MIFFPDKDKIYREEFKQLLYKIPVLSPQERAYVLGHFQDALKNGLDKYELRREIEQLKRIHSDELDSSEINKLKKKLLENF